MILTRKRRKTLILLQADSVFVNVKLCLFLSYLLSGRALVIKVFLHFFSFSHISILFFITYFHSLLSRTFTYRTNVFD